mmetsp:Transcript_25740/g.50168  ORF Transcript_25740/g.50168 Transcript_25740/m.50168 type:complete len:319 (-) Transcript_25740:115-1071(-)
MSSGPYAAQLRHLRAIIMLLNRIEGRDKLTKLIQYWLRLVAWSGRQGLSPLGGTPLSVIESVAFSLKKGRAVMRLGRFTYVWLPLIKHILSVKLNPESLLKLVLLCLKASSDICENTLWAMEQGPTPKGIVLAVRNSGDTLYFLACLLDWFMTLPKITKDYFLVILLFAKRTARDFASKLKDTIEAKAAGNEMQNIPPDGCPREKLEDIKEERDEDLVSEGSASELASRKLDPKEQAMLSAQVHRARVKFVKVTMDILSAGSKLGFFSMLPRPIILSTSIMSAACVIHLEMTDINYAIKKQMAAPKKAGDHVRDRSVF